MLFNSHLFIFAFLPLTLSVTYLLARVSALGATATLGAASVLYYAANGTFTDVLLLLSSISINYAIGKVLSGALTPKPRKCWLIAGIIFNLLVIADVKYRVFLLGLFGVQMPPAQLPLGISFFTFTQITFLLDAYRCSSGTKHPLHYLLFVSYFPHLAAGPVLRYDEIMPQLLRTKAHRFSRANLAIGASLFALGLAKKCILADSIAPYSERIFLHAMGNHLGFWEAWLGALAHALQLYFDFSGYSDMAIGLSKMLGIRLPANFDAPYKAASLIDFWRRWHISLSRFLRDYVYIPLGGNRRGLPYQCANLFVTAMLCGLWHGAGWTFILWGAMHGAGLCINHLWKRASSPLLPLAGWIATFAFVLATGVVYRADSITTAWGILHSMAGLYSGVPFALAPTDAIPFLAALLIVFALPSSYQLFFNWQAALPYRAQSPQPRWHWQPSLRWAAVCGLLFAAAVAMIAGNSPFLYARI